MAISFELYASYGQTDSVDLVKISVHASSSPFRYREVSAVHAYSCFHFASCNPSGTMSIWSYEKEHPIHRYHSLLPPSSVKCLAFSPDGLLLACGSQDGALRLWQVETGQLLYWNPQAHWQALSIICFTTDGSIMISASDDGTIKLWSTAFLVSNASALLATIAEHDQPINSIHLGFGLGRNSRLFSLSGSTVLVHDLVDLTLLARFSLPSAGTALTVDMAETIICVGAHDGSINLFHLAEVNLPAASQGHKSPINSLVFSPDDKTLISGDQSGIILFWDRARLQLLRRIDSKVNGPVSLFAHVGFVKKEMSFAQMLQRNPQEHSSFLPISSKPSVEKNIKEEEKIPLQENILRLFDFITQKIGQ